jgi:hypothetical protein
MSETQGSPKARPETPAPAPAPNLLKQMQEMADAGDFANLVESFTVAPNNYRDLRQIPILLRQAIEQASRRSPRKFTGEVYRQALAYLTYLTLRLQVCADRCLHIADEERAPKREQLPEELLILVPHIERLARLTHEMAAGWASTDRRWALARQRKRRRKGHRLDSLFEDSPN